MKTLELNSGKISARDVIDEAKRGPILVREPDGRTFAVCELVEEDLEAWSLGQNPDFLRALERSRERGQREGSYSTAEVRKRLGLEQVPV